MSMLYEQALLAYVRNFPGTIGKYRLVDNFRSKSAGKSDSVRRAKLIYGDFQVNCDIRYKLQRQFYFFGTYFLERDILARWQEMAKNAKVICDVGANLGIYSLAAAAANSNAVVHAFEPTSEIVQQLRSTLELNKLDQKIHVHQVAVGQQAGKAYLNHFGLESHGNEGMNFVSEDQRASQTTVVDVMSLDDFCSTHAIETIDLMKIDVQGNEPAVLRGASRLIKSGNVKSIFLELNWDDSPDASCPAKEAISLLAAADYHFSDARHELNPRPAGKWLHGISDVIVVSPRVE